jgi:hypothetical protein
MVDGRGWLVEREVGDRGGYSMALDFKAGPERGLSINRLSISGLTRSRVR